jgi:NADP-dependent 3-hydroxy acid dehydrogenase YdfG
MSAGTAVVVGASSAIGTAVAVGLAGAGFDLDLWGRDPHRLAVAAAQATAAGDADDTAAAVGAGGRAVVREVALDDPAAVDAAAAAVGPLTAAVYAAGLFDWGDADTADPDAWARLVQVNLTAAMRVTRRLLPALIAGAPSTLVLIGSGAARRAYPHNPAYVASKHGLLGFARATFLDVRDRGVRVSVVNPGLVAAGAGLLAGADPTALLQPADVAAAVRYAVTAPPHACVTELDLQPVRDPG